MPRVLVVHAGWLAHTAHIARHIAERLRGGGAVVDELDAERVPAGFEVAGYDAVLLGSAVRLGRHHPAAQRFAQQHGPELTGVPTAFFSVGLAPAGGPQGEAEARRVADEFVARTGLAPRWTRVLAGALEYPRYNGMTRGIVKAIAARLGKSEDTSRAHDLTDWAEVDALAEDVLALSYQHRAAVLG